MAQNWLACLAAFAVFAMIILANNASADSGMCPISPIKAYMDVTLDPVNYRIKTLTYNLSEDYIKTGLTNAFVIRINMSNLSQISACRASSDSNGWANFTYNPNASGCTNYRYVFCPQDITSGTVGLEARQMCLNNTGVPQSAISSPIAPCPDSGASRPYNANLSSHLLAHNEIYFCNNPPVSMAGFCWPLMLISALLIGASFAVGKNPFAAFDFSAHRMGRGKQYALRAQQRSFDMFTYFMAANSAVGEATEKIGGKRIDLNMLLSKGGNWVGGKIKNTAAYGKVVGRLGHLMDKAGLRKVFTTSSDNWKDEHGNRVTVSGVVVHGARKIGKDKHGNVIYADKDGNIYKLTGRRTLQKIDSVDGKRVRFENGRLISEDGRQAYRFNRRGELVGKAIPATEMPNGPINTLVGAKTDGKGNVELNGRYYRVNRAGELKELSEAKVAGIDKNAFQENCRVETSNMVIQMGQTGSKETRQAPNSNRAQTVLVPNANNMALMSPDLLNVVRILTGKINPLDTVGGRMGFKEMWSYAFNQWAGAFGLQNLRFGSVGESVASVYRLMEALAKISLYLKGVPGLGKGIGFMDKMNSANLFSIKTDLLGFSGNYRVGIGTFIGYFDNNYAGGHGQMPIFGSLLAFIPDSVNVGLASLTAGKTEGGHYNGLADGEGNILINGQYYHLGEMNANGEVINPEKLVRLTDSQVEALDRIAFKKSAYVCIYGNDAESLTFRKVSAVAYQRERAREMDQLELQMRAVNYQLTYRAKVEDGGFFAFQETREFLRNVGGASQDVSECLELDRKSFALSKELATIENRLLDLNFGVDGTNRTARDDLEDRRNEIRRELGVSNPQFASRITPENAGNVLRLIGLAEQMKARGIGAGDIPHLLIIANLSAIQVRGIISGNPGEGTENLDRNLVARSFGLVGKGGDLSKNRTLESALGKADALVEMEQGKGDYASLWHCLPTAREAAQNRAVMQNLLADDSIKIWGMLGMDAAQAATAEGKSEIERRIRAALQYGDALYANGDARLLESQKSALSNAYLNLRYDMQVAGRNEYDLWNRRMAYDEALRQNEAICQNRQTVREAMHDGMASAIVNYLAMDTRARSAAITDANLRIVDTARIMEENREAADRNMAAENELADKKAELEDAMKEKAPDQSAISEIRGRIAELEEAAAQTRPAAQAYLEAFCENNRNTAMKMLYERNLNGQRIGSQANGPEMFEAIMGRALQDANHGRAISGLAMGLADVGISIQDMKRQGVLPQFDSETAAGEIERSTRHIETYLQLVNRVDQIKDGEVRQEAISHLKNALDNVGSFTGEYGKEHLLSLANAMSAAVNSTDYRGAAYNQAQIAAMRSHVDELISEIGRIGAEGTTYRDENGEYAQIKSQAAYMESLAADFANAMNAESLMQRTSEDYIKTQLHIQENYSRLFDAPFLGIPYQQVLDKIGEESGTGIVEKRFWKDALFNPLTGGSEYLYGPQALHLGAISRPELAEQPIGYSHIPTAAPLTALDVPRVDDIRPQTHETEVGRLLVRDFKERRWVDSYVNFMNNSLGDLHQSLAETGENQQLLYTIPIPLENALKIALDFSTAGVSEINQGNVDSCIKDLNRKGTYTPNSNLPDAILNGIKQGGAKGWGSEIQGGLLDDPEVLAAIKSGRLVLRFENPELNGGTFQEIKAGFEGNEAEFHRHLRGLVSQMNNPTTDKENCGSIDVQYGDGRRIQLNSYLANEIKNAQNAGNPDGENQLRTIKDVLNDRNATDSARDNAWAGLFEHIAEKSPDAHVHMNNTTNEHVKALFDQLRTATISYSEPGNSEEVAQQRVRADSVSDYNRLVGDYNNTLTNYHQTPGAEFGEVVRKLQAVENWLGTNGSSLGENEGSARGEIEKSKSMVGIYDRINESVARFNGETDISRKEEHARSVIDSVGALSGMGVEIPENLETLRRDISTWRERNESSGNRAQENASPAPEQPAAQPNAQQEGDRPARAPAGQESEPQTPRTSAAARLQENIERHIGNTRDRVAEQAENLRDIAVDNAREAVGRVSDGVKRVKTRVRKRKASDETDDDGAV